MRQLIALVICCFIFGCKQISKTVEETFSPKNTMVAKKPAAESKTDTSFSITIETHTTTHTHQHTEGPKRNFLANENSLNKAEEALKALPQYAGKEIFIYSGIHFYDDGSIHVMLQHPENPKYIDKYEYRNGVWSEPKPEQISVRDHIDSRLVSLNKIHFMNAAKVARIYNEKAAEVEGAKPATSVYISIWDNEVRWFPTTVNGSRERYTIQFDANGELKKFERD
ncbi:hypothetical protein GFS24_20705 [Chitinophaga sp. SYP-B3965]|nr:hypothetical protein [Chitinophaga sp. SYP-B3965]